MSTIYTKQLVEELLKKANDLLLKQEKELDETKEALRRCRNLLTSEQELNWRLVKQIKEHETKV